jgi:hypothetical protein
VPLVVDINQSRGKNNTPLSNDGGPEFSLLTNLV